MGSKASSNSSESNDKIVQMMISSLPVLEMIHDMLFEGCFERQEKAIQWPQLQRVFAHCFSFWKRSKQSEKYLSLWQNYRDLIVVGTERHVAL